MSETQNDLLDLSGTTAVVTGGAVASVVDGGVLTDKVF